MRRFIRQYLDPSTRLGEVLFGLIMALGTTGAVRFGMGKADCRALFVAVLGCNIAWGIVDGVMFTMLALFERGRKARIVNGVLNAATEEIALERIDHELGDRLEPVTSLEERSQFYLTVLELARKTKPEAPRVLPGDLLGGLAVGLLVILATLPVALPFLIMADPIMAVRSSNLIVLTMLFAVGWWWARIVGANPWRIGIGVTGIGLVLVVITIALDG